MEATFEDAQVGGGPWGADGQSHFSAKQTEAEHHSEARQPHGASVCAPQTLAWQTGAGAQGQTLPEGPSPEPLPREACRAGT